MEVPLDRLLTPLLIGFTVVLATSGQFLMKVGMDRVGRVDSLSRLYDVAWLRALVGQWQIPVALGVYFASALAWMVVLSRESLSYAYPFMGLTYVIILGVDHFVLGQPIGWSRVSGTVLVGVGVVLVARGR